MSWHYLQGQEAASWEGISLDGAPDALLSLIPTLGPSFSPDSGTDSCRDSRSGTTCGHLKADRGGGASTSSLEASLARTSAQPERAQASLEQDPACGHTWRESSARWDRNSHGWKTHRCLWEEVLPWSSVILPKWGMMRDGVLWERMTPGLPINGSESGLWPTPRAYESSESMETIQNRRERTGIGHINLTAAVKSWPTPRSCSAMGAAITPESAWNPDRFLNLETAVGRETWPTPTACMHKGSSEASLIRRDGQSRENDRLDHAVMAMDGGSLNPTWVEWLMGWPLQWTSLEPMPSALWVAWQTAFQTKEAD